MERESVKINVEVEITGCLDCPHCKQKWNELTTNMEIAGIPKSVWICEKGVYGKLEEYYPQNPFENITHLFMSPGGTPVRTYYVGESFRPDYPPYIGCPYFNVDKLSSFINELRFINELSNEFKLRDGINEEDIITLWEKYGISMEDYVFPEVEPELPDEDNSEDDEELNDSENTGESGDTNEDNETEEETPSDNTDEGTESDSTNNDNDESSGEVDNESENTESSDSSESDQTAEETEEPTDDSENNNEMEENTSSENSSEEFNESEEQNEL